jgi:hypothetical protein
MDRPALVVEIARRLARVELDDHARTLAEEVAAVNASAGEDESLTAYAMRLTGCRSFGYCRRRSGG